MSQFQLDHNADIDGTHRQDIIHISPWAIQRAFGAPIRFCESGDGKVSGEYTFTDNNNNVFTVYDWKCTALYDAAYESVFSFWTSREPKQFSIGGKSDAKAFKQWLMNKIEEQQ